MRFLLISFFLQSFTILSQSYTYEDKYRVETIEFLTDSTYTKNYYSKSKDCAAPGYNDGNYLIKNDSLSLNYLDYDYSSIEIRSIKKKKNNKVFIHLKCSYKDVNGNSIGPIWGEINDSKISSSLDGNFNKKIDNKDFTLKLFSFFDNETLVLNKRFEAGFDYEINAIVGKEFINSEKHKIDSFNDEKLILFSPNKRNKKLIYIKN